MKLVDIIRQLSELDDAAVIYARPKWSAVTEAVALREPDDGAVPAEADGMTYMLTVMQAKRVARRVRRARPDLCSPEALTHAIVYFAIYDELEPQPSFQNEPMAYAMAV